MHPTRGLRAQIDRERDALSNVRARALTTIHINCLVGCDSE